ncbi:MAG: sensor histidine kinase [Streptosporangiaceae bacterium]
MVSTPQRRRRTAATISMEEQLRHVQRLVMQGELAATAVHEISNLLTIVQFNAGLLRERHLRDPQQEKYIEPMLHAAALITNLCNQLRNLARPAEALVRTVDLAEVTRGIFRLLEQIMQRRMVFEEPVGEPLLVSADPAHIDQMLVNLVLNARDATSEETGCIAVRIGRLAGAGSFIEVEDNGTGMSAEVKRRLFTAFFTTKPPGQGTGLGMATVQRLMHGVGGRITVASRPGRGARIRLQFPPARPGDDDIFPECESTGPILPVSRG